MYALYENKNTLKKKLYYFIIFSVFFFVIHTFPSYAASLGNYELVDLYSVITRKIIEINQLLALAFSFISKSPWDLINNSELQSSTQVALKNAIEAIKSASLAIAVLLLMLEFFKKSITFEWASKWENILLFLVKIIVIKQVIMNAETIIGYIYAGFNTINKKIIGENPQFLPCGDIVGYRVEHKQGSIFKPLAWVAETFFDASGLVKYYDISEEAVNIFYPGVSLPQDPDGHKYYHIDAEVFEEKIFNSHPLGKSSENFTPIIERVLLEPFFLVMWAIAAICFVIIIGRLFELTIYTIFAPLAFSTFASDTTHDIGKSFLKKYIACVLQVSVIAVMFLVYVALTASIGNLAGIEQMKLIQFICLIALGLGVIKSGAWSKNICGA